MAEITQDHSVLQAITGYCIDLDEQPVQTRIPNEIPFEKDQWEIVN